MDLEGGSHCMCLPSLFLINEFYIDWVVGMDLQEPCSASVPGSELRMSGSLTF